MSQDTEPLQVIVRAARPEEFERLCRLYEELDSFHRDSRPDIFFKPEGSPRSRDHIAGLLDGASSTILVAERVGEILGFAVLLQKETQAIAVRRPEIYVEVEELVVTARHRLKGIGRALLQAAEAWTRERGVIAMRIGVWDFNHAARALYQSEGFETQTLRMAKQLMP